MNITFYRFDYQDSDANRTNDNSLLKQFITTGKHPTET